MGYAGGSTRNPSYHNLADHTETVQVEYDPARLSYRQLLEWFWTAHDAAVKPWSRQYRSVIFYHDEEQRQTAEASKAQEESRRGVPIYTEIVPYTNFYLAEGYHQKYYLQLLPQLMGELRAVYPDQRDFINSTVVARINGYLAGYGSMLELQREIGDFGLSPAATKLLTALVGARVEQREE